MTSAAPSPDRTLAAIAPWQISLLGAVSASREGERLTQLGARSVFLLLARLALQPRRSHSREELIELLWPGVAIETGRNRLRQTLFSLRQILEPPGPFALPVLEADRIAVRVVPGRLEVDVARFEAALREGRADEALALYRGELLPGFYDSWVIEERHRLAALAERAEGLAAGAASSPSHPAPRRVDLPAATVPARAVQEGARPALPIYLTRSFGRQRELARLSAEVLKHRLVTLHGAGGSGKTRLAVELAEGFASGAASLPSEGVFDVIAFASLVGCTTGAQMIAVLVATLRLRPVSDDLFVALVAGLEGRRALIVLDNFEQLVDSGGPSVARLVETLPTLHLLVTSRRALALDGERIFAVEMLALPQRNATLAAAVVAPALALFVDRARAVRADFAVRPPALAAAIDLVGLLEGLPLAIELAAARVRSMTPAQMVALLRPSHTVLGAPATLPLLARAGPRSGTDPRHASMQSVIAWSWQLLAESEAATLAATTVFRGGFTAAAAASLCAGAAGAAALPVVLDGLVGHSLLRATVTADETIRYASLEPVREFAAAQLSTDQSAGLRERHRSWCIAWAQALPATPSLAEVRAEMANVRAALASGVADDAPDAAIRLALPLRRALEDVELPADGIVSLETALERCCDAALRAQGLVLLGPLLFLAGRSDAALATARAGLARSPPGVVWRGRALHAMARVQWRHRRRVDAELVGWVDEAAAIADRSGDIELQASLFALRGFIANGQRDHLSGEALHRQALLRWEGLGNRHAIHSGRYNLAVCAQSAGRHREALERIAEIEPEARELHDWRRLSQLLNVRGKALSELHAWHEAAAAFRECTRLAWDSLAMHELAYGVWNVPRALAHLRKPVTAIRTAAFAAAFWQARFGALSNADRHDLRRVRRLCARQLGAAALEPHWAVGSAMTPAEVVALLDLHDSLLE